MADRGDISHRDAGFARFFCRAIPHNAALGLEVIELGESRVCIRLPYRDQLAGNPDTGVLHGGAITALLDAACGAAVYMKHRRPLAMATLDLRIDYLKPASPARHVLAEAECYKLTRNVAFVRGIAFHDDRHDPIASCSGTFVIFTSRRTTSRRTGLAENQPNQRDGHDSEEAEP